MWLEAKHKELRALDQNNTWVLHPHTSNMNVVDSKWIKKTKLKSDDSVEGYKARLVAQGYIQFQVLISVKLSQ